MALILIVDDALLSRNMVKKIVKNLGHSTIEAKDGEEALTKIKEEKPDFVCLDMLIPKLTGLEVLQKLQQESYSIPIVMITADTQETTKQKGLELGAIAVLNKPVKSEQLEKLIVNALNL
ncbi:response regulator transcription factor [Geminocystis sp. CENA526]|uniref:response regulator transcription factor n=1 Tax=Geminocystis sp. CENA526 TaxID=1355871 RepID=UPI003D6E09B7